MKSTASTTVVIILIGCLTPAAAFAQMDAGLDQYQLLSDIGWAVHSVSGLGQWFTVGTDGVLSGAEFSLYSAGTVTEDLVVKVFDYTGGTLGALRGSTSISIADLGPLETELDLHAVTTTLIPLEHLGLAVSSGDALAIRFTTASISPAIYGIRGLMSDNYANGSRVGSNGDANPDSDLMFKTFVAQPVFADGFESSDTSFWSLTQP